MSRPETEWNVLAVEHTTADAETGRSCVQKARGSDAPAIKALIDKGAWSGEILPRTLDEIVTGIRDFVVYRDEQGAVSGCCAAHVDMASLAEVRSLVVAGDLRGRGIGRALVMASVEEARVLGIKRVYALTRAVRFFETLGFERVGMDVLPQKVFKDCMRCSRYDHCDETAMILDIRQPAVGDESG